ncbi:MAG TPA: DUF86 domain-containing protein [Bacillales bacterium]|nr:DUF86 domain-containing protein [Bacillales bacterium]
MYFVDREKIEQILLYMEKCLKTFESEKNWSGHTGRLALERLGHVLIEAVIDVGNQMIDGFIMRDPGSYADILDILADERVVSAQDAEQLKAFVAERNAVVRTYASVPHRRLAETIQQSREALGRFPEQVRRYLTEELGPVSAFLPREQGTGE